MDNEKVFLKRWIGDGLSEKEMKLSRLSVGHLTGHQVYRNPDGAL